MVNVCKAKNQGCKGGRVCFILLVASVELLSQRNVKCYLLIYLCFDHVVVEELFWREV
jgi:hypothetical protein